MTTRFATFTPPNGTSFELMNGDRTVAYIRDVLTMKTVIRPKGCAITPHLPGIDGYTSPECDEVWWYDPEDARLAACMAGVAGFLPMRVDGLDNSTTTRRTYDLIGDGAALGRSRRGARLITITGVIVAETCCGASAFQRALNAKLEARTSTCGGTDNCGGGELRFLECPPCNDLHDDGCGPNVAYEANWTTLCNVALVSGVRNTRTYDQINSDCGACRGGFIREISFDLIAGDPSLWSDPIQLIRRGKLDIDAGYCNDELWECCPTIFTKVRQSKRPLPVHVQRDCTLCPIGWTLDAEGKIPEDGYLVPTTFEEVDADEVGDAPEDPCPDTCALNLVYNRVDGTFEFAPIGDQTWQEDIEPYWDADLEQYCNCTFEVGLLTTVAEDPDEVDESPFEVQTVGDYRPCCHIELGPPVAGDANSTVTPVGWDPADGIPDDCIWIIDNVCPPEPVGPEPSSTCLVEEVCRIDAYVNSAFELVYEGVDAEIDKDGVFPPPGCIGFEIIGQDRKDRLVNVEVADPDCGCGNAACLVRPDCDAPTPARVPRAADPCAPCMPVEVTTECVDVPPAPGCKEGALKINIRAGGRGQQDLFVRVYRNPDGKTDPREFTICDICVEWGIAGIQKKTELCIDGQKRRFDMICADGTTIDASSIITMEGQWPTVGDEPLLVCLFADSSTTATKLLSFDVLVYHREN